MKQLSLPALTGLAFVVCRTEPVGCKNAAVDNAAINLGDRPMAVIYPRNFKNEVSTKELNTFLMLFKYHRGNRDNAIRLPSNGSTSMNLDGLFTRTTVTFNSSKQDSLTLPQRWLTRLSINKTAPRSHAWSISYKEMQDELAQVYHRWEELEKLHN